MNELALALGWIGIYSPMAIGAIGSSIGCAIAGQAGIGAMLETEGGMAAISACRLFRRLS